MRRTVPNTMFRGWTPICGLLLIGCPTGNGILQDSRTTLDAMVGNATDASRASGADAAAIGPSPETEGAFDPNVSTSSDLARAEQECLNLVDDDGSGRADCTENNCATQPICCVGSADPSCCVNRVDANVDFSACTAGTVTACFSSANAMPFGASAPFVRDGAMVPNGTRNNDSGFVLPEILSLHTSHITLRAATVIAAACSGCVDGLGIGLAAPIDTNQPPASIVPFASVVVSGTLQEARFFVDGSLRQRVALTVAAGATVETSMTRSIDGRVAMSVMSAGITLAQYQGESELVDASLAAQVVVYGRSTNVGANVIQTSLRSLQASVRVCDNPQVGLNAASVLPANQFSGAVRGTSVSENGQYAVFVVGNGIYYAERNNAGRYVVPALQLQQGTLVSPLIGTAAETFYAAGVADPFLAFQSSSGRWHLFFTATDASGRKRIGHALGSTLGTLTFGNPTILEVAGVTASDQVDGPALLATARGDFLFFRVRKEAASEIRLNRLHPSWDGGTDSTIERLDDGATVPQSGNIVVRNSRAETSFAYDEVAAPHAIWQNDVCRIYFAGRNGARWSIGLVLSQDFEHFSLFASEPVWRGGTSDENRLGVQDPSAVFRNNELVLFGTALASNGGASTQSTTQALLVRQR